MRDFCKIIPKGAEKFNFSTKNPEFSGFFMETYCNYLNFMIQCMLLYTVLLTISIFGTVLSF